MVKAKKRTISIILLIVTIMMAGVLASCSQPKEQKAAEAPSEEQEELMTIGVKSDDTQEVIFENGTGKTITALAVKLSTSEAFGASLLASGNTIEADVKVRAFIPKQQQDAVESAADTAADVVLRDLYNVSLTFSTGENAELHNLNFSEVTKMKILLSDNGIAYVEYELESGQTENTLVSEEAYAEAQVTAKALAEETERLAAEAQAQADAQAQAEASNNQANVPSSSYTYDYNYGASGDNASSGYSATQEEDQCVDDVILR